MPCTNRSSLVKGEKCLSYQKIRHFQGFKTGNLTLFWMFSPQTRTQSVKPWQGCEFNSEIHTLSIAADIELTKFNMPASRSHRPSKNASFANLAPEVLTHILTQATPEDVLALRKVSKNPSNTAEGTLCLIIIPSVPESCTM